MALNSQPKTINQLEPSTNNPQLVGTLNKKPSTAPGKPGTLRILFCFENGAISGDGQSYGIGSALEQPYQAGYVLGK